MHHLHLGLFRSMVKSGKNGISISDSPQFSHPSHIDECHKSPTESAKVDEELPNNNSERLETVIYFLTEEGEEAMLVKDDQGGAVQIYTLVSHNLIIIDLLRPSLTAAYNLAWKIQNSKYVHVNTIFYNIFPDMKIFFVI